MKISTQTDQLYKVYGYEGAIKKLAEIGYDCYDFSMFDIGNDDHPIGGDDFRPFVENLRKVADQAGISCNQSHAPFPSYLPGDEEYNKRMFPLLVRAMEVTSILGGGIVIIHPAVFPDHGRGDDSLCFETNMELYNSLLPYAKEFGVKIALENMFNWYEGKPTSAPAVCSTPEEFVEYLDALDPDYFVACLDIGHCSMANGGGRSAHDMIHALGNKRLKSLHIHDNDLIYDLHALPFTESIDWDEAMTALKDIGYDGEFTFEADNFLGQFPEELREHASRLMLELGRYFVKKYDL